MPRCDRSCIGTHFRPARVLAAVGRPTFNSTSIAFHPPSRPRYLCRCFPLAQEDGTVLRVRGTIPKSSGTLLFLGFSLDDPRGHFTLETWSRRVQPTRWGHRHGQHRHMSLPLVLISKGDEVGRVDLEPQQPGMTTGWVFGSSSHAPEHIAGWTSTASCCALPPGTGGSYPVTARVGVPRRRQVVCFLVSGSLPPR